MVYVKEGASRRFVILDAGAKKAKILKATFFPAVAGAENVEINGSPAIADGRVYFATSEEFYCIGAKTAERAPTTTRA